MEKRKENKKENKTLKRSLITIIIILILLIIWLILNKKTVIFDGNGADSGKMESIITYSKMELEKNTFEKANYTFVGWKVYNNRTKKYSCKEGWFTEEEIKENNYTIEYLTTEEMKERVNSVRGNSFTITAQWGKEEVVKEIEPAIDLEEKEEVKKIETVINLEEKKRKEKRPCIKHNYELISEKKETCTENGRKEYKCKDCDKERIEISKSKGHEWKKKEEIPGTCKEEGKIIEECTKCKETREELTQKGNHNYEEKIIKEATSKEEGLKEIICTECGDRKEEILEKLPKTDLEILKENLEGESLEDVSEFPIDITINDVTIKITGDIYTKELEDDKWELIIDVIYNNKHYSVYVDSESAEIIEVKENNIETKFKYGKKYVHKENKKYKISIEENGDATAYEEDNIEDTIENYFFIYRNNLYYLTDEGGDLENTRWFEWIGEISEDGTYFDVDGEIYILEEKYEEVIEELDKEKLEELRKAKGYFAATTRNIETGQEVKYGMLTIKLDEITTGESPNDYLLYILLSTEEEEYSGHTGLFASAICDLEVRVGTYEFTMTDGTTKTIKNPVFGWGEMFSGSHKLWGYFPDENTFVYLETELDETHQRTRGYHYSGYTSIQQGSLVSDELEPVERLTRQTFKEVELDNVYMTQTSNINGSNLPGMELFVGFNEKGVYIGIHLDGYYLTEAGARKYSIRENYIQYLEDGEVKDYTGKRVIVLEEDFYPDNGFKSSDLRKGDVIGYINEDNTIIQIDDDALEGLGENDYIRVKNEGELNEFSEPQTVEIDTQEVNILNESLVAASIETVELKEENEEEDIKEEIESEEEVKSKIETEELAEEIKVEDEMNTELEEIVEEDVLEKEENLEE